MEADDRAMHKTSREIEHGQMHQRTDYMAYLEIQKKVWVVDREGEG